jgi:hypothetical protein
LTPKTVENQLRIAAKKMYIDLEQYFQKMKIKVS